VFNKLSSVQKAAGRYSAERSNHKPDSQQYRMFWQTSMSQWHRRRSSENFSARKISSCDCGFCLYAKETEFYDLELLDLHN